ncbi:hypothetical protein SAMN05519103_09009 [Rhizobiales bacterium GAS113]|nr:hypothetical protein SAMN05519103_09009 [Rhizobiales bacterium GAS113]
MSPAGCAKPLLPGWIALGLFGLAPLPGHAQPVASCMADAATDICDVIGSAEFRQSYRETYLNTTEPADAIDDLRDNMRRVLSGAGQAGPAALGLQVDAALDDALGRAQRLICVGTSSDASLAAGAIAVGLAASIKARGALASADMLGAMTGTLLGAARRRGGACLCAPRHFDGIRETCKPSP